MSHAISASPYVFLHLKTHWQRMRSALPQQAECVERLSSRFPMHSHQRAHVVMQHFEDLRVVAHRGQDKHHVSVPLCSMYKNEGALRPRP
jgi:hypothetical protein